MDGWQKKPAEKSKAKENVVKNLGLIFKLFIFIFWFFTIHPTGLFYIRIALFHSIRPEIKKPAALSCRQTN
jgi:hypothetical protein